MDFKIALTGLAVILMVFSFYPYIRDIFRGKTRPHLYTWLIWGITQATATVGLIYGGGGLSGITLALSTFLVLVVAALCFRFGTKNITRSDTVMLIAALVAIVVWWQLNNPLLAVFMVSVIDFVGYIPTWRKTYQEPWSETLLFWIMSGSIPVLILFTNSEYNLLTTTYLLTIITANVLSVLLIYTRRKATSAPEL